MAGLPNGGLLGILVSSMTIQSDMVPWLQGDPQGWQTNSSNWVIFSLTLGDKWVEKMLLTMLSFNY